MIISPIPILNLIGLFLITYGSIMAASAAPSPQYNSDGSVSITSEENLERRKAIYKKQKRFPHFIKLIAFGAFLQALGVIFS